MPGGEKKKEIKKKNNFFSPKIRRLWHQSQPEGKVLFLASQESVRGFLFFVLVSIIESSFIAAS